MLSTNDVAVKYEQVMQQTQTLVDRVQDAARNGEPLHQPIGFVFG